MCLFISWDFGLFCPKHEHAAPQPRRYKPLDTIVEEFFNRQVEVFSINELTLVCHSTCVPYRNTDVRNVL